MSLLRLYEVASRLLAVAALVALGLTRSLPGWLSAAALAAVGYSLYRALAGRGPLFSRRIWDALNVVALAYFLLDIVLLSESLLIASTHFVLFLMINKLFNLTRTQDYTQLYLICLLELLAASTFTVDLSFAASFTLFLLAAVWALLLHHLVGELRDRGADPAEPERLSPAFVLATNGAAAVALVLTALLFVLLPRVGLGIMQQTRTEVIRTVGFTEKIDLGDIGPIKQDLTVVMRVKVDAPALTERLYWRGMAFDRYDGSSWENSLGRGEVAFPGQTGEISLAPRAPERPDVVQEIMLEPLDTEVIFGASQVEAIRGEFRSLRVSPGGGLTLPFTPSARITYRVRSQLPVIYRADAGLAAPEVPRGFEPYLQLPPMSARVRELAQAATAGVSGVLARTRALQAYLQRNYRYSLDIAPPNGNALEDFLFVQKQGYCEHYATAMVVLLRSIGIPARLVSGFSHGEFNAYGGYYIVRQRDAHTWVEVWFPTSGWVPFDPTPTLALGEDTGVLARSGRYLDTLRWQWNRYVVYFSPRDQFALLHEARADRDRLRDRLAVRMAELRLQLRSAVADHGALLVVVGAGAGAAVLAATVRWLMRRPWFRSQRGRLRAHLARSLRWLSPTWSARLRLPATPICVHRSSAVYRRLLRRLRARGLIRAPSMTPQELAAEVERRDAVAASAVRRMTELFETARYGHRTWTAEEERELERLLRSLPRRRATPALGTVGNADGGN